LKFSLVKYLLSYVIGAVILTCCSVFQKIIINANPFEIKGYLIPIMFGGISGLVIYFFQIKWKEELLKVEKTKFHYQLQKFESLERMAGAIAHNYNNLMFIIMGNLEMAIEDTSCDSNIASQLTGAMGATHRALKISEMMLTYLGHMNVNREPQNISKICRKFLSEFSDIPTYVNLNIDIPEISQSINADSIQIQQALENLLINAWESLNKQPGVISVKIRNASLYKILSAHQFPAEFQEELSAYVCLEVNDTGCGMTEDDINKIFDPFYSTKFTGRGLGLAMVLGTVKAHEGCIIVESTPKRGSIFKIFLPLMVKSL